MQLYDSAVNGAMGAFVRDSGGPLPITTWSRRGDTLAAILISPDPARKWLLSGNVVGRNEGWTGALSDYANSACEIQGYSKMDFLDGKIVYGNMLVADIPSRE